MPTAGPESVRPKLQWFWCDRHGDFAAKPLCPQCEHDGRIDGPVARAVEDASGAETFYCPECRAVRRFEYKAHLDEFAGECGHRLDCTAAREQRRQLANPAVEDAPPEPTGSEAQIDPWAPVYEDPVYLRGGSFSGRIVFRATSVIRARAAEIALLRQENERRQSEIVLCGTCRNGAPHYCPNCDNSFTALISEKPPAEPEDARLAAIRQRVAWAAKHLIHETASVTMNDLAYVLARYDALTKERT